jgi:chemotaxis signal transduction protein
MALFAPSFEYTSGRMRERGNTMEAVAGVHHLRSSLLVIVDQAGRSMYVRAKNCQG